jgi:hypothetical protein
MYPSRPGLIIGFHGCDEPVRNAIASGNTMLKASQNGHDWLGFGFYFWENNYDRALDFAIHPPGKKQIKTPAVLGAVIDLEFCLDLMETKFIRLVKESYDNLRSSSCTLHKKLPENKKAGNSRDLLLRDLDCAVIENLHHQRNRENEKAFDSARGLFIEGDPIYEEAGFHEKTHVQICIRNPNCIKGFFVPRQEMRWAC